MIQPVSSKNHSLSSATLTSAQPPKNENKKKGTEANTITTPPVQPKDTSVFSQAATRRAQELTENKAQEAKETGVQEATEGPEAFSRSSSSVGGK